jgi:hypothetical protein
MPPMIHSFSDYPGGVYRGPYGRRLGLLDCEE